MIRELLIFASEARAGGWVVFSNFKVTLPSVGSTLPRISKNLIMLGIDQCVYENGKLKCEGWAYCRDTYEPVKRVFVAVRGRLLGVAAPVLRVDVRQHHSITYDNTGYRIVANTEHNIFNSEMVQIFLVTGKGVVVHEVQCRSDVENPYVMFDALKVSKETISVSSSISPEIQSIEFKLSNQCRMHIDEIKISDDSVIVHGWAVLIDGKDTTIYVGVGVGQRLLPYLSICCRPRADVSGIFTGKVTHDLHGFTLVVPRSDLKDCDNISVLALAETFDGRFAGLTSLSLDCARDYSEDLGFLSKYSKIALYNDCVILKGEDGGGQHHFVKDDKVHIAVDKVEASGDKVRISGWCAHMLIPSLRFYVGLRMGDKLVSLEPCLVSRPDVAETIGTEVMGTKLGFEIYIDRIEIENADMHSLGIVAICIDHGCGRATVGLKSTDRFEGSYLHRLKYLFNNVVRKAGLSLLRQSVSMLTRSRQ